MNIFVFYDCLIVGIGEQTIGCSFTSLGEGRMFFQVLIGTPLAREGAHGRDPVGRRVISWFKVGSPVLLTSLDFLFTTSSVFRILADHVQQLNYRESFNLYSLVQVD
jgi:hypothetical protein